ncbi:hypothetical protein GLOIN_2v1810931 [Rhizophagus clarus]|uniref:Uncharacterized protein n=1 Tax=Rhizophagus clarus TaxID=94130 RepID=A0A8H3L649_9GLOM|nr:hypothetical protein GLOIN_2v1810931 [Rhizophagus clarus]
MILESENPICIYNMKLGCENQIINIKYNSIIDNAKLDAYVCTCDEALLGLAQRQIDITKSINDQIHIGILNFDKEINQQPILDDDDESQDNPDGIVVDEQEFGNGVYRSIRSLLKILIPIWNKLILQPGNTINLKLGGDSKNVGRKQNYVMITICLLNKKDEVLKPDNQYCICPYVGKENYETLVKVGHLFEYQLWDLQENGIYNDNGVHWPIEFFFSNDWKFMYNIMGLNTPNVKYFCLYCNCEASEHWNMDLQWPINKNTKYELHLMLHISDVLMECFFNDLFKRKEFEQQIKSKIKQTMKAIKIHFEFFKSKSHSKRCGKDIEKLWRDFYELYLVLRKPILTNSEIDDFEVKKRE